MSLRTLLFVESLANTLSKSTLSAISAAKQLSSPITAIICTSNQEKLNALVKEISSFEIEDVVTVSCEEDSLCVAEKASAILENVVQNNPFSKPFSHIIGGSSTLTRDFFPRLAARLNVSMISDVIDIQSSNVFKRPTYAGNIIETVKSSQALNILTVRATSYSSPEPCDSGTSSTVLPVSESVLNHLKEIKTEFIGRANGSTSEGPNLLTAHVVIGAGRGIKSKEDFANLIKPLAQKLNAAVGATRALVDAGVVSNDLQLGQTGKVVAPSLYIGVGLSGAIQHYAGVKDSAVIVAVNKDEHAPIFDFADVGLVGDIYTVLPEMAAKL
eukprot:GCRY01004581.1.p1 GENE.GCRY01004581.1~~GCRY01004581.1.p1  ORF type:complete len:328 (+),score=61.18 GCRY01004581.1:1297-2280(+)